MPILEIPVAYYGTVRIEATQEEFESSDSTLLYDKAERVLHDFTIYDLDDPEIFMCDAEFVDD